MNPRRWVPTREELLASRWLRPVAHHLQDDGLWHMNRQSVARAAAIGLFFGLLLPFAQFLAAVVSAVIMRAHVPLAAAFTLVTNPLTFAPIYWLAHRIGSSVLGGRTADEVGEAAQQEINALSERLSWIEATWAWLQAAGAPLLVGLLLMAIASAVCGYVLVWLLWRPHHAEPPSNP